MLSSIVSSTVSGVAMSVMSSALGAWTPSAMGGAFYEVLPANVYNYQSPMVPGLPVKHWAEAGTVLGGDILSGTVTTTGDWVDNGDGSWTGDFDSGYVDFEVGTAWVTGQRYVVEFDLTCTGGASVWGPYFNSQGRWLTFNLAEGGYSMVVTANADNTGNVRLLASGTSGTVTVSNMRVRPIVGGLLEQTVDASCPILCRHPKTGVRNLIDASEDLTNAYWDVSVYVQTTSGVLDPTGGTSAIQIDYDGTQYGGFGTTNFMSDSAKTYAVSFWARSDNPSEIRFSLSTRYTPGFSFTPTGTWQKYTGVVPGSDLGVARWQDRAVDTTGHTLQVAFVQIEEATAVTPYQCRVSQYDVTEDGVDDCYGLWFDGVDDFLATVGTVDFSAVSQLSVGVGFKANSIASRGTVVSHNGTSAGSLSMDAPTGTLTGLSVLHRGDGSTRVAGLSSDTDYHTLVGASDLTAPLLTAYGDGAVEVGSNSTDPGVGPFADADLVVGATTDAGSNPFNGIVYGGVVFGKGALSLANLVNLAGWLVDRTPEV